MMQDSSNICIMSRKLLKYFIMSLSMLVMLSGCNFQPKEAPVTLTWKMELPNQNRLNNSDHTYIIKNVSGRTLDGDWSIYFCQLPFKRYEQAADAPVKHETVSGTFRRLSPTEHYGSLAPGDSIVVKVSVRGEIPAFSMQPEAAYWVSGKSEPVAVKMTNLPLPDVFHQNREAAAAYDRNNRIQAAGTADNHALEVIPAVKKIVPAEGELLISDVVRIESHPDFAVESRLLGEKLASLYDVKVDGTSVKAEDASDVYINLEYLADGGAAVNDEYYELHVSSEGVRIAAKTAHGVFNGTQTLLALLKGQQKPYSLKAMDVADYPDLMYRSHMQDVVRCYADVDDIKKLIDVMSSYKMNAFRFHFSDDEGWRLEIPGLEELTEVGGRRGHTLDESECLYPSYDGGFDCTAEGHGNGWFTRDEFIGMLRYAAERHVNVIPEIESPGHARAAIVAMKARYNKYKDTDLAKAEEYLLSDPADTSKYLSAQVYDDNVMNVAMPSTYRFMEKVIDEIAAMYEEAGVPLKYVHIGGDEVARGAWEGSPVCHEFMRENGMETTKELSEYFIKNIVDYLDAKGIPFGAWQEVALGHKPEFDEYLAGKAFGISCWRTLARNNQDELVYQFANKGYPVILSNVTNFYFDLVYGVHPEEPGHNWGGFTDESKSFAAVPFNVYRSIRNNLNATEVSKSKTMLTEEGRKNIRGVESALWCETVRGFENMEYLLFPKMMGLAERGWKAFPEWEALSGAEEQAVFEKELAFYYRRINLREMPYWEKMDVNYHLASPGVIIKDGMIHANTHVSGAQIRYTTDGTDPAADSHLWTEPVYCDGDMVKAKLFHNGKESVTVTVTR